ncbi:MAG: efflux transporter outer membrane subunit [Phycisphaerae bacterium]|nr:efflux transporter outer membrane subunit [Phycisphaerae bacterium]
MRNKRTSGIGPGVIASAGLLLLAVFSGCQPAEKEPRTLIDLPTAFSQSGSEPLEDRWWLVFDDPELDALMDEALGNNFSIRSTWDRLRQAEQTAVKAGAPLLPGVAYDADVRRTRVDRGGQHAYSTAYSAGLVASYELDLWGRVRSVRQAAAMDAQAAQENVAAAAITLSAAVARTWYQLAEARLQQDVIARQIEANEKVLQIITLQFRQSHVGASDVLRQRQLVESGRAQLVQTSEAFALLQHQLSILLGRTPSTWWAESPIALTTVGVMPQTAAPATLIWKRPDILRAYRAIEAADKRVAAAVADQYPRISIVASADTSAIRTSDLFDDWAANLIGNLAGPLFDAGLRKAEVERTRAVVSELVNAYGQAVLQAIREVEDAIRQEAYQREYIASIGQQLKLATQVYERTRHRYLGGQLDYLRVLESLISQQSLERNELTARRVLVERRIDLCRSLAGGWEMERPEMAELR